ncbi:MAG: T9SS type A sorting domain-containing protein [Paramuribaculum sp.]|nr:T9SS type A sorting domain-containing protein [Paramuribaculum sp.]
MKKYILNILAVLCVSASSICADAMPSQDQAFATERLENETATVSPVSTGISLSVKADKTERFYIFSITGQLVKTVDVEAGSVQSVELPRGCYIVKCSYWSKKVMVK